MLKMNALKKANRQGGFVITAELLLVSTVLVIGLITGMAKLRDQAIAELSDTGNAIGAIDQSFGSLGTVWSSGTSANDIAETASFAYDDDLDAGGSTEVGGDGQNIEYAAAPTAATDTAGGEGYSAVVR